MGECIPDLSPGAIQASEAFQLRMKHAAYTHGLIKVEHGCQIAWELGRGMLPLRTVTAWANTWPGYEGGTKQWVKDTITDRRILYVLSPSLNRWVSSYKVWDALSSADREDMLAWVLKHDAFIHGTNKLRLRRMRINRDEAYQYIDLLSGELSIPANKSMIDPSECLVAFPEHAQEGLSDYKIDDNPNFQPENQ